MPNPTDKHNCSCTRKLLGILFSLVFTVILIELFSFLATRAKLLTFNETPWYTMHRHLGMNWRTDDQSWGAWHAAHAKDRHVTDCYDVTYQSNNVGARDTRDYDDSLAADSMVLIGDSFAEGYGVNIEQTFAKLVERQTGRTVMNFGSAGHMGPVQQDLIYRELASRFPHNELIYMFLPANDFTDNAPQSMGMFGGRYRPYYKKTDDGYTVVYPEGAIRGAPYPGSDRDNSPIKYFESFLAGYTYTFNTLKTLKYTVSNIGDEGLNDRYFTDDMDLVDGALYFVNQLLSGAEHKKITVIVIPTVHDMANISRGLDYHDKHWYTGLKQIAGKHDARLVDLAMYIPQDDYEKYYLPCDGHWNPEGNAFAAKRFLMDPQHVMKNDRGANIRSQTMVQAPLNQ